MINKKGQAAMEFLMTYGWAILAAVIAIGVLAYFGVFSPGKYMPEACVLNAPFGCNAALVNTTGVYITIQNGVGSLATVTNVTVGTCDGIAAQVSINESGYNQVFIANASCTSPGLVKGSKFRGDITIHYTTSGSTYDQVGTGSLTKTISI
jgi:hypothetical protein